MLLSRAEASAIEARVNEARETAGDGSVRAVGRALRILTCLAGSRAGETTLGDISEAANLAKSTAHRLLGTLVATGFVEPADQYGHYRLGLGAAVLGSASVSAQRSSSEVQRVLLMLTNVTRASATLDMRSANHTVTVDRAEPQPNTLVIRIDNVRQAHSCAAGKMLLSLLTDIEVLSIYRAAGRLARLTPHTLSGISQLVDELNQINNRGYALEDEEQRLGVRSIAVAVPPVAGRHDYSLSISASAHAVSTAQLTAFLPVLREAAVTLRDCVYREAV